jgi:basic membrane protein A and related proteins
VRVTLRSAALVGAAALVVAACGAAPEDEAASTAEPTTDGAAEEVDFQACMVSDAGGIDDRSFNASAWAGLQAAEQELGVTPTFVESKADTDYAPNINSLLQEDCGIIITVGFLMGDATTEAATANSDQPFAIVDSAPDEPVDNLKPLLFDTAQAAYLAGYLAAGMSETGTVATFGGIPIPPVTVFMDGFVDGVAKYNDEKSADVQVLGWDKESQNGSFTGDFEDQNKGKQVTQNFIQQGADIILPVAGPVGLGAAAAAQESDGVSLVWVDSDGFETAPDFGELFITSVLKRIDSATEAATEEALSGEFSNEVYVGTLENEGVGLAPYHEFEDQVPDELKAEIDDLREQIISGEITVESPASPQG